MASQLKRYSCNTLICLASAIGISLAVQGQAQGAEARNITIGTGSTSGVYYPVGKAICKFINQRQDKHGIHCSVAITSGSVDNINRLRDGTIDFAIAQSDVQFYATKGYGPFQGKGPYSGLNAVLSLHPESFTVLARATAGIRTFDDLKGKRVNIGPPGSGQRTGVDLMMHAKGWTEKDFALTSELSPAEQSSALCGGDVDAVVFTVGHPNASIKETAQMCDTVLVQVFGPAVKLLTEKFPYFTPVTIPGKMYPGSPLDTKTFGVTATLVTDSKVPDKVVYTLIEGLFNNFTDFKFSAAALFSLQPNDMSKSGLTAPMHAGADKYFQEMQDLSTLLQVKPAPHR